MTNVYATTVVGGFATLSTTAVASTQCTYESVAEARKQQKYNEKIKKITEADYTYNTDVNKIALALHYLNPDKEIRTINPDFLSEEEKKKGMADRIIFASVPVDELDLPTGVGSYKNAIYTYEDDGTPYYIRISDSKGFDKALLMPETEDRKMDLHRVLTPVALLGTTTATVITGNTYVDSASAATYDAKTYMESISDTELEELCTNLEEKTLDEQINETLERENVKKLVK